ncbi:putative ribonuclease BN [Methylococcus capsulatus str. Bath]|uniref:Putative ribonuclease BN n=1 Tax=Methylococcus capsulatus (strain ATCC 33009 / NCIMB 11132 / Bath) TaxID=243233 RepID=Q60AX6_METCA|nr:YhjD/YihY/BrkB family envelope integrity protein [Methylococcus capsulatus]AAU93143.1 putative ribonuclease BN [Methylococcus capsulatus str. Bath]
MNLPYRRPVRDMYEPVRRGLTLVLRCAVALAGEIRAGGLDYRAMSLVYTSLLALIPLLAVAFSVLKAFGAHTGLEPLLSELLDPLGANAEQVKDAIIDSVKRMKVGVLGFLGFLFLFYVSITMLDKIEESFNHVWRTRTSRNLWRRLGDYLSFTLVGPLLLLSAFGSMTGLLGRHSGRGSAGWAWSLAEHVLPYAAIILAFTLFYWVIPSARVKLRSALFGGVVAGAMWELAGWVFGEFVAGSSQYHAVYSSFAILVLFMVWLYVSWLIVLLGAQCSFFFQNPQCIGQSTGRTRADNRLWEHGGLALMYLIVRRFMAGQSPPGLPDLAESLNLPEVLTGELLSLLQQTGLIVAIDHGRPGFLPARDPGTIAVLEVFEALRGKADGLPVPEPVALGLAAAETSLSAALAGVSLRDWAGPAPSC